MRSLSFTIVRITSVSVLMSAVITYVLTRLTFGADPRRQVPLVDLLQFSQWVAIAVPLLVCPPLAWRNGRMARKLASANAELQNLARTDQLTGLLNRRGFDAAASAAFAKVAIDNMPVAGLICDIDFFKRVNDEFGHNFGDAAIVHLAHVLREIAGEQHAIVGRQGGEEFVVLLPGLGEADALAIAERCRRACSSRPVEWETRSTIITVSIGVAVMRHCNQTLAQLLQKADVALYEAKQSGRNRVVLGADVGEMAMSLL